MTPETPDEFTVSRAALGEVTTFCKSLPQPLLDFKTCQGDRAFQVPVIRWSVRLEGARLPTNFRHDRSGEKSNAWVKLA
jgi:hypothetical protein